MSLDIILARSEAEWPSTPEGCVLRKLTWADGPKTGLVRFKRKDRTKDEARLAKAREIEK